MMKTTIFERFCGAWKVMSQHNFPSLTVALLTLMSINFLITDLNGQNGICNDPPPFPLELTATSPVYVCAGSSVELSIEVSGGVQGISRVFGVYSGLGGNPQFIKGNLDSTNLGGGVLAIDDEIFGAATFVNGTYYTIDLDGNNLLTIDTATYAISIIGNMVPSPIGHVWTGLSYDASNNRLFAVSTSNTCAGNSILYEINPADASVTQLFSIQTNCVQWLGINGDGEAFVLDGTTNSLYSLDITSGNVELIGAIGQNVSSCTAGDFDPETGELFVAISNSGTITVLQIDPLTASSAVVSQIPGSICGFALLNSSFEGYQYSWSPASNLSATNIPNPVASPNSNTTYTVVVTDACGNTAATTVSVLVETPLAPGEQLNCILYVQVSVDQNCQAVITPDMILAGNVPCANEEHTVNVAGRGNAFITSEDVGQTLMVEVTRNGNMGNRCWGNITVEDKMPPTIECSVDTISCIEVIDYPLPVASDNCGPVDTVIMTNEIITDLCGTNPGLIRRIDRTFFAVDASGNVSSPCLQTLYIETVDVEEIEFPDNFTKSDGTALSCTENFPLTSNGYPSPDRTGYPTLGGVNIGNLNTLCGISASFHDMLVISNNCKTVIERQWSIFEHCNHGWTVILSAIQTIEIVDDESPSITCPPDITVTTTSNHSCTAGVFIPRPAASDICNDVLRIDLNVVGQGFYSNWQGGNISFGAGQSTLNFTAFDDCNNFSSCTTTVIVNDMTPPVPICKENTVVSLTIDGTARVFAASFDNGSYDECGNVTFDVRRMDQGCDINLPIFRPYVDFYCCDLLDNPIMVVLRVTDESGNQNECMVNVEVQDKLPASITCPPHITVSCEYPFDFNDLTVFGKVVVISDLVQLQNPALDPREPIIIDDIGDFVNPQPRNWGVDGFAYDNCALIISDSYTENIDMCGTGTVTRTFTAMALNNTPSASCQQIITIENLNQFGFDDITWPADVMLENTCIASPDVHPNNTGFPIYERGVCDNIHHNYTDEVYYFNNPNDPTCFKIIRRWTVIDWCQFEYGQYRTWTWHQTIKVNINDKPVITGNCSDFTVNSIDPDCQSAPVTLTQSAEAVCTAEEDLIWRYDIDVNNNGIFELSSSYNPFADNPGNPTNASGTYPVGVHRIVWTVTDGCGNTTTCQQIFTILNTTQPKVVCQSIAIELMPMDTNGDGNPDWAMLEINAALLDKGSYHNCGYGVSFSFSTNPANQTRVFTCDDLGEQMVSVYVHSANGAFDLCVVVIDVQDNNNVCPPGSGSSGSSSSGLISGSIIMEDGEGVKDAEVSLVGSPLNPVMSSLSGSYQFPAMPFGGSYEVLPFKNDKPLDGVTTYDIALMQRHILGTQVFQSPYQWIAADIDNNGVVDVRDVAALRRMVLGVHDDFQYNTSWRFVDAGFFFTGFNPLDEQFNESYRIPNFDSNMTGLDFIAVKVGDLNNSVDPSGLNQSDERSQSNPLVFEIEDLNYQNGDVVEVSFTARKFEEIDAFQFTLLFEENQLNLLEVRSDALKFENSNIGTQAMDQGILTISWNDIKPVSVSEGEVLFTLVFESVSQGSLASGIQVSSLVTQARAYERGEARNIVIEFSNLQTDTQNYELFQNRPNPFTDETIIGFRLGEDASVTVTIFDVTGKVVRTFEGRFNKGYNELRLNDLGDWTGQVYYYRLDTDGFSATKKMILVR